MINVEEVNAMDITTLHNLADLHGVPIMKETVENWKSVEEFQARPDDLVIATYPKAGTTWMCEIVDMIYCGGDPEKCKRDVIYNRVPYMEFTFPGMLSGVDQLKFAQSPRLVKTHLPIQLMPESFWENNCKVIYVARNAKDVAVSYFFFHNMFKGMPDPGPWAEFLEHYIAGRAMVHGMIMLKGWWEKRHDHRILYLFYEDLKEDPKREIKKILDFLERKISDETVDKIVHHTSFQEMKNNDMVNYKTIPNEMIDQTSITFMRKGEAGDWKNHFTVAQNIRFDEDYERQMAGQSLYFKTEV